jgi:hypothetical protein
MNIYIIKASKEYYSLFVDGYTLNDINRINKLTPLHFKYIYEDICGLMYDTYKTLFNVKLEHPIREYIKLAEKHNCKIIKQTVNGYMLRLPVFTSLEDAEAMKKEMEIKRILIELKE